MELLIQLGVDVMITICMPELFGSILGGISASLQGLSLLS
jgi:hypothetical protein